MTDVVTTGKSTPHWPAVAAWWAHRVQLLGPRKEQTELLFVQACPSTGLDKVHPTWAGIFVLAAIVALCPGIHFILLDNDCVPLTLFEVEDLWALATPPKAGLLAPNKNGPADKSSWSTSDEEVTAKRAIELALQALHVLSKGGRALSS